MSDKRKRKRKLKREYFEDKTDVVIKDWKYYLILVACFGICIATLIFTLVLILGLGIIFI